MLVPASNSARVRSIRNPPTPPLTEVILDPPPSPNVGVGVSQKSRRWAILNVIFPGFVFGLFLPIFGYIQRR